MKITNTLKLFIYSLCGLVLIIAIVAGYKSLNRISPNDVAPTASSTVVISDLMNDPTSTTKKPVIKSFDMPQSLSVGQTGTWTIHADDSTGGGLMYSATWGDEILKDGKEPNPKKTNSPTFTHAYSYPGDYSLTLTVYGSNGQSVYGSFGVNVLGENTKSPVIFSASPNPVIPGTLLTINGAGFASENKNTGGEKEPPITVTFGGKVVNDVTTNGVNTFFFIIPNSLAPGKYPLVVKNSHGTSNTYSITISNNTAVSAS